MIYRRFSRRMQLGGLVPVLALGVPPGFETGQSVHICILLTKRMLLVMDKMWDSVYKHTNAKKER